jgi:hypothetical protein
VHVLHVAEGEGVGVHQAQNRAARARFLTGDE